MLIITTTRYLMLETVTYKKKLRQKKTDSEIVAFVMRNVQVGRSWKQENIDNKIACWEKDYNKDVLGNEQEGRSKVVDDTVHNYVESVVTNIQEPITNTSDIVRMSPNTNDPEVIAQAQLEEKLINFQFSKRINKFPLFEESVKLFVRQGCVATKIYWKHKVKQLVADSLYEGKEGVAEYENLSAIEYEQLLLAHKTMNHYPVDIEVSEKDRLISCTFVYDNIISENPDFYNVPITNMFWDPTARQISFTDHDFTYVGEIKIESESTIRGKLANDDTYKKLSKEDIALLFQSQDDSELHQSYTGDEAMDGGVDAYYRKMTQHVLGKNNRSSHVVIEYHGYIDIDGDGTDELVHIEIVNGKLIKLVMNEYLDDMIPYNVAMFDRTPFTITGESIPSYLKDVQYLRTAIARGMHDSIAYGMLQNYAVEEGDLSPIEEKKMLGRRPGELLKFKPRRNRSLKDRLVNIQSEGIKSEYFTMYSLLEQQAQENSGITAYTQGLNSDSLNQTATGVSIINSASMKRMWRYATTFIEMEIKYMLKAMRIMNKMLLDETKFTMENQEYTVSKDMLDIDSDINVNVAIKGFDTERVTQIIQLLQMTQPLVQMGVTPPEVLTECVKQLAEIWDMRKLANMISPEQQAISGPVTLQGGGQGTEAQQPTGRYNNMTTGASLPGNNTIQQI